MAKPLVEPFPAVAALYRNVRDNLDSRSEPQPTAWSFKLAGNAAMAAGTFEPSETALVRRLLADVDVLVNIGANIGYYCCHALSLGTPVIAFEPIQRNVRYLCRNIKANGWSGVEVYPIALSNAPGILEIYGGDTGASLIKGWAGTSAHHVSLVPSSTLDTILGARLKDRRALIIMDVEGAEQSVLEGAAAVLANCPRPIWLVEIAATSHQPNGVQINPHFLTTFELFRRTGYRTFSADQEMRPLTADYLAGIAQQRIQADSHNFIFRE